MSLMQRVERAQQVADNPSAVVVAPPVSPVVLTTSSRAPEREELLHNVRLRLQEEIVGAFNTLVDATPADARAKIEALVDRVMVAQGFVVTRDERLRLILEMVNDVTGLGPLEPLLNDESITEIMVNGPSQIYIERAGKILRVDTVFLNNEHVLRTIDRIITPLGRRIDDSSPRVDARLADGSRVNAIIEPLSLVGPVITVRKFAHKPYTVDDLIRFGTATPEMFAFLQACIEAKLNLFVSGGTGSGKTTTLNVISSFIPNDERIVTIEDAAELQLRQEHVITLEARPPNLEGEGEITIRNLLRNAMHMRPDRIIVGECRAGEALDMLQAMTTGHDGSLSTGHANSPKDMLRRLETMVLMTGSPQGRLSQDRQHHRDLRHRGRRDPHPGHLCLRADRRSRRQDRGRAQANRHPADVHAAVPADGDHAAARRFRDPLREQGTAQRRPSAQRTMGRHHVSGTGGQHDRRPGARGRRGRDGLRLGGRTDRPRHRSARKWRDQGARAAMHGELEGDARGKGQLARQGRLGELVSPRRDRIRRLLRGMGALVPR